LSALLTQIGLSLTDLGKVVSISDPKIVTAHFGTRVEPSYPSFGRAGVRPRSGPAAPNAESWLVRMDDKSDLERLRGDSPDWEELFARIPELPALSERWTVRRKAAVIQAVRGGWVPIEEIVRLHNLSVDEFLAWERDVDRYGVPGLRTTRFQIYRGTERRKR
jgi:hypothetical protein